MEILYSEGGEAVAQAAQTSCDALSLKMLKARIDPGQPELVVPDSAVFKPARNRGVGTRWSLRPLPTQANLRLYNSTSLSTQVTLKVSHH